MVIKCQLSSTSCGATYSSAEMTYVNREMYFRCFDTRVEAEIFSIHPPGKLQTPSHCRVQNIYLVDDAHIVEALAAAEDSECTLVT